MFGISVYLQDLDLEYIQKAADLGAKYVFTSLHIPEENYDDIDEKLPKLLEVVRKNNLSLVPDVSPRTFEKLSLEDGDYEALEKFGFNTVRLDYGYDDFATVKKLTDMFVVMLNASTVSVEYLKEAVTYGIDLSRIILSHNFYPRKGTGLTREAFIEKNKGFAAMGVKVQAFVTGDQVKRFPLYEGLPTLEMHRGYHPLVATIDLVNHCHVTEVIIGDSEARVETLTAISQWYKDKIVNLKMVMDESFTSLYGQTIGLRVDMGETALRLTTKKMQDIAVCNNTFRRKGALTQDNNLYGRYAGEMQLIKHDMDLDARVNVLGYIHPNYIEILEALTSNDILKFIK